MLLIVIIDYLDENETKGVLKIEVKSEQINFLSIMKELM